MIYLYGLAAAEETVLSGMLTHAQGLQGPLKLAHIGPWCLIYSDHDDQEILPKRRLLLAHTRVLETVLPICTILPARFGLVAQDLAQVSALVEENATEITAQFAKVTGAIELGVRISFPRQVALDAALQSDTQLYAQQVALRKRGPEAHFAIAEFGGRLADLLDQRRGVAQRATLAALRPLTRDHVLRKPEEDTEVLRAEFLVDANAQDSFQDAVAATAAKLDFAPGAEPLIQMIGPVPMYHFVRLNLGLDLDQAAA
ncbi:gas vesicle protein GvpL/GvpF [Yoonia maricola]|uniref:Gas vesicle protein GvpL/GvpF n=1 Tax=Yoonia maricola TaxID=420999 RepID=A0A2M8WKK0_9RHOB|nr:GvpL/GvpF family gas vesicle protein [Yoonia maricola]PJI91434.1 gas vesicle protein GvpL/GvpF [Yoonia maricola]